MLMFPPAWFANMNFPQLLQRGCLIQPRISRTLQIGSFLYSAIPQPLVIIRIFQSGHRHLVFRHGPRRVRFLFLFTVLSYQFLYSRGRYDSRDARETKDGTQPAVVMKTLGAGRHVLKLADGWIYVSCSVEKENNPNNYDGPRETLTLTAIGTNAEARIFKFIQQAVAFSHAKDANSTIVYDIQYNWHPLKWGRAHTKQRRSLDSVILDSNVGAELLRDVNEFLSSSQWYKAKGVPYRRSYLLYGPPGSGKTYVARNLPALLILTFPLDHLLPLSQPNST